MNEARGPSGEIVVSADEYARLEATAARRLNVGSGEAPMTFWTNLDQDPQWPAEIHARVPPLPFADESLDEIYAGHFIEHLTHDEAHEFVRECYRCLTPGGRLGLLAPDTREVMRRYLAQTIDAVEYPYKKWRRVADLDHVCALFLYSTVQNSPHRWAYDLDTLARLMEAGGFVDLAEIDRYTDARVAQGAWYQMGIDGYKPKPPQEAEEWPATFDDEDEPEDDDDGEA